MEDCCFQQLFIQCRIGYGGGCLPDKANAPLHIYDAEKLLSILKEEDFVRLVPDSYHNYMGYQEEGTVYELPWEYECSDEKNSFLTLEQYHDIISHTEWDPEKRTESIS